MPAATAELRKYRRFMSDSLTPLDEATAKRRASKQERNIGMGRQTLRLLDCSTGRRRGIPALFSGRPAVGGARSGRWRRAVLSRDQPARSRARPGGLRHDRQLSHRERGRVVAHVQSGRHDAVLRMGSERREGSVRGQHRAFPQRRCGHVRGSCSTPRSPPCRHTRWAMTTPTPRSWSAANRLTASPRSPCSRAIQRSSTRRWGARCRYRKTAGRRGESSANSPRPCAVSGHSARACMPPSIVRCGCARTAPGARARRCRPAWTDITAAAPLIYAVTAEGGAVSEDAGATWRAIELPGAGAKLHAVAASLRHPEIAYVSYSGLQADGQTWFGVAKTADRGRTWSLGVERVESGRVQHPRCVDHCEVRSRLGRLPAESRGRTRRSRPGVCHRPWPHHEIDRWREDLERGVFEAWRATGGRRPGST